MKSNQSQETQTALLMEVIQLRRILWLVANQSGGKLTVDEAAVHPLWGVKFSRPPGQKTELLILSDQLPDPTPTQLDALAEKLMGTNTPIKDAMLAVGLVDYPATYVQSLLSAKVVWQDKGWMKRLA